MRGIAVRLLIVLLAAGALADPAKSWRQQAWDALMAGDIPRAVHFYEKWIEADPNDAAAWYNLACCYSVTGQIEKAITALSGAADAGWSDSSHTASDKDLASLRSHAKYSAIIERIARNARNRYGGYVVHTCPQPRIGEYVVVLPEEYDPARRYPLVILLHGYGQSAVRFAAMTGLINARDFIYAVPQGPYVALDSEGKGFSHLRESEDFQEDVASVRPTTDWIIEVASDVARRYPTDGIKCWLVGFSQGAAIAHETAARHPDRIAGYCAHGGYLLQGGLDTLALRKERENGVRVLITHGRNDQVVIVEEAVYAYNSLRQAGIQAELQQFDVAHEFTAEVGLKVNEWLRKQMAK